MQSVSTFGAFTTARLGMYAAQKGLDITGHNITNINTIGYTRQSLNQISLRTGGNDRYQSLFDTPVGSGVLCTGVTQLRDPYLDIRFRNEQSSVGAMDSKLAGLESLSQILDEVGKGDGSGVIEKQFNDLVTQLQYLNTHGAEGEYDALVRSSASTLAQLFNSYSKKLDDVAANQVESFKQDLETVNNLVENIRDLNASIRSSEIHGDGALEQRDSRNVLIDKLSQYMKIDVTLSSEQIGEGQFVEKLTIKLAGGNSNATLVEGGFSGKFSINQIPATKANAPNPSYDEAALGYIGADGKPTAAATYQDAGGKDVANAVNPASLPYLGADGKTPTADPTHPVMETAPTNPGYSKTALGYIGADGKPTADATYQDADGKDVANAVNPDSLPHLDYDGKPTADATRQAKMDNPNFELGYSPLTDARGSVAAGSGAVSLGDGGLFGGLQSSREILTEKGEFATAAELAADPKAGSKRGIPYYRNTLDVLARKFAETMNTANRGTTLKNSYETVVVDGVEYIAGTGDLDPKDPAKRIPANTKLADLTEAQKKLLNDPKNGAKPSNKNVLFSTAGTNNNIKGITAGNLSVSQDWASGTTAVCKSHAENPTSGDTSNIAHIIILLDSKLAYKPGDLDSTAQNKDITYYTGSFQGALGNISATLAHDKSTTTTMLKNYAGAANELATSRDAVSGVELNDEAASLMQYQKSYSAACRLMTTIDEMLDKLINGTGIVGR